MHTTKELLIRQVNAKSHSAFRELFGSFYGGLSYYSFTFVRRQDVAEDIVQDAFGRLWDTTGEFPSYNSLVSYLYTTVRNASLDWLKHERVERRFADTYRVAEDVDDNPEQGMLKEEVFRLLMQAVEELPPRCREVFKLYLQGHKSPKIAEMLELSVDTVRTHRKNALKILREKMGDMFVLAIIFNYL